MKIVLSTLNAKYIHSSLALFYLKAYCGQQQNDVIIKEYTVNNGLLDILSDLYGERPDVIGLACYIWNIEMTLQLVRLIRKVLPGAIIILGGPEVSYDSVDILKSHPEVDFIVQGEGEEVLAQLLTCLAVKEDPCLVQGLTYRRDGQIVSSVAQVVPILDELPFPYSSHDIAALKDKIIYYESSRGCPFSCQYCLSSATLGVRFLPVPRVIEELTFFIKHNVKQVKFVDRTFNASKEHYLPILKFLAAQHCSTNFHFEIAADILDEETLDVFSAAPPGRFQLEIGVQSTHEPTLRAIRRTNNWPKIVDNVTRLRHFGNIHMHLDLIAGLPFEDYERFGKSFDDVFNLKPHMLQLGFLKLLKGSGIREQAALYDYIYMDTPPYEVLANQYISYGQVRLLKILEEVLNQTYNSGRFIRTTEWLIKCFGGSGFEFFRDFSRFWEQHKLHLVSHSAKTVYQHYASYCKHKDFNMEVCLQLLKFDALTADRGTIRPEFLPWNSETWDDTISGFFRSEGLVRRYIPEYRFSNWRQVKKHYHIEVFDYDIIGAPDQKYVTAILFWYEGGSVEYMKLDLADLGTEDK